MSIFNRKKNECFHKQIYIIEKQISAIQDCLDNLLPEFDELQATLSKIIRGMFRDHENQQENCNHLRIEIQKILLDKDKDKDKK